MATTIAKLNIHVGTTTAEVIKGFTTAESAVGSFARRVSGYATTFAGLFGAGSVAGIVGWGTRLAADAETSAVSFRVLLKDAGLAKQVLMDMRRFADTTPFEFPDVREAGRLLTAFGVQGQNVVGTLHMLGDVASGIGIPLKELADIFGRNLIQGKLMTKDIREFAGRGIPIIQVLSKELGITSEAFMAMVESGQINSKHMVRAFELMTQQGGQFHKMMEEQSKTLSGRWSTLKDAASSLALQVGESLLPTMKKLVEVGFDVINWLKNVNIETVKNVIKIGVFVGTLLYAISVIPKIVRGVMAIVQALRTMAIAQTVMQALSGPKGWATLAASLAIAAGAAFAVSRMFDGMDSTLEKAAARAGQNAEQAKKLGAAQREVADATKEAAAATREFVDANGLVFAPGNAAAGVRSYLEKQQQMVANQHALESLQRPNVGAVSRFTTEGFSAVIQGLNNTRSYHDEIQKQQLEAQQAAAAELKRVNGQLEKAAEKPPIILTEVSL